MSATILALEIACRFLAWYAPTPQAFPTAMQQVWMDRYDQRNSLGFRDREPSPTGRPLLAVVGDSFAFGWGINRLEDRYGEQLAALLGWDSINAAVPATNTLQHIEYVERILPFRPTAIVLLYVFNDIDYLRPEPPWATPPLQPLFRRSHLYQQIVVRLKGFLYVPRGPDGYLDDEALAQHARDLRRLTEVAGRDGAIVGIVPFIRMRGDDIPFVARDESESQYERLVRALRAEDAPVWPIADAFAPYERRDLTLNSFDVHPNEKAHRIAAEATLPYVQELSH